MAFLGSHLTGVFLAGLILVVLELFLRRIPMRLPSKVSLKAPKVSVPQKIATLPEEWRDLMSIENTENRRK